MSRLVTEAASVIEISSGETYKQINKHINAAEHSTHASAICIGEKPST